MSEHHQPASENPRSSRRDFIQRSAAGLAGGAVLGSLGNVPAVHAAGVETLKEGLIGCGGRGSGAAINAMNADPNVKLTAMGDLFEDSLQLRRRNVQRAAESAGMAQKFAQILDRLAC